MPTAAYVSTPVLSFDGQTNADAISNLISLSVVEDIAGMRHCEARFNNYGVRNSAPAYLYLGRDVFDFGKAMAVRFGPSGADREVFAGKISALQADYPAGHSAQVVLFAEDNLQAFRMTRRTRSFDDSSTSDIAQTLAGEHGLTPDVNLDGPTRRASAQLNKSDLAFLRELARADDGEVWLDGTTLHVQRRPDRSAGSLTLTYTGNLLTFSVRADLADQVSDITVAGWDVAAKDGIAETAGSNDLGAELASGDTGGSSILQSAFATRSERIVREAPLDTAEAKALAKAAYLERARRFVCGTGLVGGEPSLQVGMTVTLDGLGPLFNGGYYVTATRHCYDAITGYRTEFEVERAGIGAAS